MKTDFILTKTTKSFICSDCGGVLSEKIKEFLLDFNNRIGQIQRNKIKVKSKKLIELKKSIKKEQLCLSTKCHLIKLNKKHLSRPERIQSFCNKNTNQNYRNLK